MRILRRFKMLWHARRKRLLLLIGLVVTAILVLQSFTLRTSHFQARKDKSFIPPDDTSTTSLRVGNLNLLSDSRNSTYTYDEDDESDDDIDFDEDTDPDTEFSFDLGDGVVLKKSRDPVEGFITLERVHNVESPNISSVSDGISVSDQNSGILKKVNKSDTITLNASVTNVSITLAKKKKKTMLHAVSVSEMNKLLLRNRASYRSMRPRWSSTHDKEMLDFKTQIQNAPIVKADRKLFAPIFRNISTFRRSYELMEKKLKVYVYKEGKKPIFHEPLLKGIYASEGWFMKQMETNRQYVVKNPKKAQLFYMPFSSRLLQFALYVRNSHNRRPLEQHLRSYVDLIASKYPFWNRSGGADHFLAACHDWAPYETRHTMDRAIRALCVSDLREGFRLGKDVSLPETYVRSAKNPLRDIGGKPANERTILAFFAGNLHGRLRPVLLQHWENKDPDMKIFGPLPRGPGRKATYIQFMKDSKYCLCPRGYEANSPRVVEAIFFECVPVIISDNYVPPFFEILNWDAFAVFVAEKDVANLKTILTSIPKKKYLELQNGVRKVQHHFLWHTKAQKYDLFHMILHSVWFNRVNNVRTR